MRVAGLVSFYLMEICRPKKSFVSNQGWNTDHFIERILQTGRIYHGVTIRLQNSVNTVRSIALGFTRNTSKQNDISSELSVYNKESWLSG
jgi:hypothetical protein